MLIGGDDISNDLSHVFQCVHLRLFPLRADWQKSDSSVNREKQGKRRHNSNSRDVVASSPSFSCPTTKAPESLHSGYIEKCQAVFSGYTLIPTTYPQFTCAIVPLPFISSATSARTSNFFKASRSEINIV